MNLDIGTHVGDYRILSRAGRGAYGIVFEAEHVITRRVDAVKLMLDAGPSAEDEEQRFLREIQVQASLHHDNIAQVYTAFRTPWGLALAMEMVPGEPLSAILRRGRPRLAEGVGYVLATLAGLSCAEHMGIVHRDIKPDNILITPDGRVKLTDFGLAQIRDCARITASGESLGTPCYMSPEQVTGTEPADARTDVYSTGVVLYEVVTGRPPFEGPNGFAVMLAHRDTAPEAPSKVDPAVGVRISRVILKALEKDPSRRFQNAAEFREALEEAMAAPQAVAPVRQTRWMPRVGVAACVCGAIACGAWVAERSRQAVPLPALRQPAPPVPPAALVVSEPKVESLNAPAPVSAPRPARRRVEEPRAAVAVRERVAAPPPKIAEPPVDAPATKLPEAPAMVFTAPAELPAVPKKPNVVRRALGRIFGKRENREAGKQ